MHIVNTNSKLRIFSPWIWDCTKVSPCSQQQTKKYDWLLCLRCLDRRCKALAVRLSACICLRIHFSPLHIFNEWRYFNKN